MRKIIIWLLPFILSGCDLEPKSYEDCILKKVTPGMNEKVLKEIKSACRGITAKDVFHIPDSIPLPKELYQYVTGEAGIRTPEAYGSYRGYETKLVGEIYNGIQGWTITGVWISLKYSHQKDFKKYSVTIEPYPINQSELSKFSINVESLPYQQPGSPQPRFEWYISGIVGIRW